MQYYLVINVAILFVIKRDIFFQSSAYLFVCTNNWLNDAPGDIKFFITPKYLMSYM